MPPVTLISIEPSWFPKQVASDLINEILSGAAGRRMDIGSVYCKSCHEAFKYLPKISFLKIKGINPNPRKIKQANIVNH